MGGWNYTFTIGYDAPLQDFVKRRENGEFVLAVPFLTPIKDVGVDEVKLTIRLPEGAKYVFDFTYCALSSERELTLFRSLSQEPPSSSPLPCGLPISRWTPQ